ncbi:MAG TPA: dihydrolipoamide acetyltransferase family protein, partial [Chthonomonadales bacterium]|nr:dihydrolipoamide acetyltransferase family protein [Chthonomonadales bacterium]
IRSLDVLQALQAPRPQAPGGLDKEEAVISALTPLRKRIAENVVKSAFTAPHVTLVMEVDAGALSRARARLLPEVERDFGCRLSFTDLLVRGAAAALVEHRAVNSALIGDKIYTYKRINIGVAVALDDGLVAPVIHDADGKPVGEISRELKELASRARAGRSLPDDFAGGTFTITNLGALEIDSFDPVIVPPQAAILGVGRIAEKPVARNGKLEIGTMMKLCLSFDHRVLDGYPAARFLQRLKQLLEDPEPWLR